MAVRYFTQSKCVFNVGSRRHFHETQNSEKWQIQGGRGEEQARPGARTLQGPNVLCMRARSTAVRAPFSVSLCSLIQVYQCKSVSMATPLFGVALMKVDIVFLDAV